ncbi:MAG: amidohydrolase family protein [Spongiibacteraceae bacterium]
MDKTAENKSSLLIRGAELPKRGLFDLRITDDRIDALAAHLEPKGDDKIIEAQGKVLLPGLHDHHLHLFAAAAARASIHCGPPAVRDEQTLRNVLEQYANLGDDWLRGVGFHDNVCPTLDRYWLDDVCPNRPLRIQHRSGMLWVLNSRALSELYNVAGEELPAGVELDRHGKLTGRFINLDAWLGQRIPRAWPSLKGLSADYARFGITSVTDTGVSNGIDVWNALSSASKRGEILQRVLVMGSEDLHSIQPEYPERIDLGPLKLYLRETDLPDIELLAQRMRTAHTQGRSVAIHCVTLVELHVALAALADAGVRHGDRIEHCAIADDYALQRLAELGITVVTQPHFIAERGDQYLCDVDVVDIPLLYRGHGFLRNGVQLAGSSDAPYGSIDPWASMRAAVERRSAKGVIMKADECLSPAQAIALYGGSAHEPAAGLRELAVGQLADLCLLDTTWDHLCADLDASHVALTICGGRIIYRRDSC